MSPFAEALRQVRFVRGLRQQELAERVGCERSYVSALENDAKQAPSLEFVSSICEVLRLDGEEAAALHGARSKSRRRYSVPAESPKEAYEVASEFFARIEHLSALQLQGLMTILLLGDLAKASTPQTEGRVRRKDRIPRSEESAM